MVNGAVIRRYAEGLLLVAKSQNRIEQIADELGKLTSVLQENQELHDIIEHPLIPVSAKMNILKSVFGESLSSNVYNLLNLLCKRKRADYILPVANRYQTFAQQERGEVSVELEVAEPLDEQQLQSWQQRLGQVTNRQALPVVRMNPKLIAGYRIKIGDRVLDATLSGALRQFEQKLKAAGAF